MQLFYPWQWLATLGGVGLTLRLPLDIDLSRLHADVSFPHRLRSAWNKDRVYVILDLDANSPVRAAFPPAYLGQAAKRCAVRAMVSRVFDYSERLHPAGRRANQTRLQRAMSQ